MAPWTSFSSSSFYLFDRKREPSMRISADKKFHGTFQGFVPAHQSSDKLTGSLVIFFLFASGSSLHLILHPCYLGGIILATFQNSGRVQSQREVVRIQLFALSIICIPNSYFIFVVNYLSHFYSLVFLQEAQGNLPPRSLF